MRVEIEVPVVVTGRMKPSQSHKWVFASVPRVFDIPEYSSSEVPEVLSYVVEGGEIGREKVRYFGLDGMLFTDRGTRADSDQARQFHFDYWGNTPVHPFFVDADAVIRKRIEYIRRESIALAHQKMIPAEMHAHSDSGRSPLFRFSTFEEIGVRHFNEEGIDEQVEAFQKRLERMILVDGKILVSEQEPIIKIGGYSGFAPNCLDAVVRRAEPTTLINLENWANEMPYAFLSIADYASTSETAFAIADRFNCRSATHGRVIDIEIGDPRYLNVSGEALTLAASADIMRSAFVATMSVHTRDTKSTYNQIEEKLMGLPPTVLDCAQRLYAGILASDESHAAPELEEAVSDALEIGRAEGNKRYFGSERVVEHAKTALEAWHDRPVSLEGMRPAAFRA